MPELVRERKEGEDRVLEPQCLGADSEGHLEKWSQGLMPGGQ